MSDLDNLEGQHISVGGIITDVQERMTKNGKPFGKITLEDHYGTYEHAFFGDDWLKKFRSICMPDVSVVMKGRVERKKWGDHALFFNVNAMDLLSEIAETRLKALTIDIPSQSVNNTFVELLHDTLMEAQDLQNGIRLKINIINEETGEKIHLRSGKLAVKMENKFLDKLSEITLSQRDEVAEDLFIEKPLHFTLN